MMPSPLLAFSLGQLWYAIPLIAAVSLVYGATRHEYVGPILVQAWRTAVWIATFIGIVGGVILLMSIWT